MDLELGHRDISLQQDPFTLGKGYFDELAICHVNPEV